MARSKSTYSHGQTAERSAPAVSQRGVPDLAPPLGIAAPDDPRAGQAVAAYLETLKSPHSVRAAKQALRRALRLLGEPDDATIETIAWWKLRKLHVQVIRRALTAAEYSAATNNLTLAVVRGVARCAFKSGDMSEEDYRDTTSVKGVAVDSGLGWILSPEEVASLFKTCRDDTEAGIPSGPRDGAILGMFCAGMKREEVVGLTLADVIDAAKGEVYVASASDPDKGRTVWLPKGAAVALTTWIEVRGAEAGPLWARIRKGGHLVLPAKGLSGQSLFKLCIRRGERAGLSRRLTPVDLRRTFIARLLEAGVNPTTVQGLVGHKSVSTTSRYTSPAPAVDGEETAKMFDIDY